RQNDPAQTPNQQVSTQQRIGTRRTIPHSAQGDRNEEWNDYRVEDNRRENGRRWRVKVHDVHHLQPRQCAGEQRRHDREVFRDIVSDRESRQRAARHQQLLADLNDLEQLGRVAVEVDHVASFFGGLGARVHRETNVGLRQRRRIVGAITDHRDELAVGLLLADVSELRLGRALRDEVIDARFFRDRRGGERIVAGYHNAAHAHPAQTLQALADAGFQNIGQYDDTDDIGPIGDGERGSPLGTDRFYR